MSTPDDPRSRRAISALSHGKPKPYRRQLVDEPFRLSRVQIALLVLGATVIGGLILTVAVVAQEHANATRGKEIITAQIPGPTPASRARGAALTFPDAPPPMLDDSGRPIRSPRTPPLRKPAARGALPVLPRAAPAMAPLVRTPAGQALSAPLPRALALLATRAPAASDPDVELIASILLLTPPPESADPGRAACPASEELDQPCARMRGIDP